MTTLEFNHTGSTRAATDVDVDVDDRSEPLATKERRGRRPKHMIADIVLLTVCVVAAVLTLGSMTGHWRTEVVLTGSMRPGIQPGDIEILRPEPASSLHTGQIIAFHPPKDGFTVTHRVVAVRRTTGAHAGLWITTRGDANNVDDPWGSVRVLGSTVWVVRAVVPGVGFLSAWLRSPVVHLVTLLTMVLLAGALALRMIWRS